MGTIWSRLLGSFLVAAGILISATPVFADSDGYFCSGSGYIAAEFRSFSTPGLKGPHVLKIISFDEQSGPRWTGEISVEDFQTHRLECDSDRNVIFEGVADHGRGLVTYRVKVDKSGIPITTSISSDPSYIFQPKEGPQNLGLWASPGTKALLGPSVSHRFQLRFIRVGERREDRLILHDKRTVLEESDATGVVIRSLLVLEGTSIETID